MKAKRKSSFVKILLNNGCYALVDKSDSDEILKHRWVCNKYGYAQRAVRLKGKWSTIRMHRQVMKAPLNLFVDHINHNKLDNRKKNLRLVTPAESNQNYKNPNRGVSFDRKTKKYRVEIGLNNKSIMIGYFKDKNDAINAARKARSIYYTHATG